MQKSVAALWVCLSVAGCASPTQTAKDANATEAAARDDVTAPQRIANAANAFTSAQPKVWPDLPEASFQLILVQAETEALFCPAASFPEFPAPLQDMATGCATGSRARTYPAEWLATFPAVGGVPTIVVGTPEATGQAPRRRELTLIHEHFHQIQMSQPGYGDGTLALGLSGGDESGMWMLNYAFPYDRPDVVAAFEAMGTSLRRAVDARGKPGARDRLKNYLEARDDARRLVGETHWKYYELQVWQEGVPRWFELAAAASDPNYAPIGQAMLEDIRSELANLDLAANQRVSFYALGAGEALILETAGPDWRENYFSRPYELSAALKLASAS
jgi:hypothetical protein